MEQGSTSTLSTETGLPELCIQKDILGCVKWFNSKVGYGFITNLDTGDEIFAHHSNIKSDTETFRYLVQGEYIQFSKSYVSKGNSSVHATDITGVRGGKLLCDVQQSRKLLTPVTKYTNPVNQTPYRNAVLVNSHTENVDLYEEPLAHHSKKKEENVSKRQYRLPTSK